MLESYDARDLARCKSSCIFISFNLVDNVLYFPANPASPKVVSFPPKVSLFALPVSSASFFNFNSNFPKAIADAIAIPKLVNLIIFDKSSAPFIINGSIEATCPRPIPIIIPVFPPMA